MEENFVMLKNRGGGIWCFLYIKNFFCFFFLDVVWSMDFDFLFFDVRVLISDFLIKNISVVGFVNFMGYLLEIVYIILNFFNFVFVLMMFVICYLVVFWYMNKILLFVYVVELFFMSFDLIFMFVGFFILYKFIKLVDWYNDFVDFILNFSGILGLYIISGFVVMFLLYVVFEYSVYYFMEKFKKVDRKYNLEKYKN